MVNCSTRSNEKTFAFNIKNINEFFTSEKIFHTEYFYCSAVKLYLEARSIKSKDQKIYIRLYLFAFSRNDTGQPNCCLLSTQIDLSLKLLHHSNDSLSKSFPFKDEFFENDYMVWGKSISYDDIVEYMSDEGTIKLEVQVKADETVNID